MPVRPEVALQGLGLEDACVDASDLFQVVVAEYRMFECDGMTALRVFDEHVAIASHEGGERHDEAFADRVDRRVGHLCEELLEITAEVLRLVAEHGEGRICSHRTDGFLAVECHGCDDLFEIFPAVSEGLLIFEYLVMFEMGEHDAGFGQFVEPDLIFIQPVCIRFPVADIILDLFVADDPSLFQIDDEHPAGLQASFLLNERRIHGKRAGFTGHDDAVIGRDTVSRRAKAVPVEGGADDASVGEGDGGGSVPGFHDRGVVFVECLPDGVHHVVIIPCFRDEHHHDMGQGSAGHAEQFDDIVEAGAVRLSFAHDGQEHVHFLAGEVGRSKPAFAGFKPVQVPLEGVDLPVVRDEAEGLGQLPGGESVGGKTGVHQSEGADNAFVAQVGEIVPYLMAGKLSFIDNDLV